MITVKDHWHTILLGVLYTSNGSKNSSFLIGVLDTIASQECCSIIGELDDDWRVDVPGSLEDSTDGEGGGTMKAKK